MNADDAQPTPRTAAAAAPTAVAGAAAASAAFAAAAASTASAAAAAASAAAAAADPDVLVIGGGLIGLALAVGLQRHGRRVVLLDEGDDALRAARGNFGLVWVQGKGHDRPAYARWTREAAAAWPAFAAELADATGIDVELRQPGGFTLCLSDDELASRASRMTALRAGLGGDDPFEILDGAAVRARLPAVGPAVVGAVMSPLDGHVNPLRLLRALVQAFTARGGFHVPAAPVHRLTPLPGGGFRAQAGDGRVFEAPRLVLAAGLGNRALAPCVGLAAPVRPNRGQILVTERLPPFLHHPTMQLRQTGEGVVQIGDSMEDVGLDDGTTLPQLARIAARAVRCFPRLARANIVRSWGALRVMTPDGYPVYEASRECPGAFVATCHSGVTLAAQHAGPLAAWMAGGSEPALVRGFKAARFAAAAADIGAPSGLVNGHVAAH